VSHHDDDKDKVESLEVILIFFGKAHDSEAIVVCAGL